FGIDEAMPEWIHYLSEIYPNPAREEAYMNINLSKTSGLDISIISIAGQVVHREHMVLNKGPNQIKLDLHDHNNGVYFVNIEFEERYTIKKKLLLMQ
ncbi:MAG: T9SS type A sorting domain-containing protein, partial [Bacteroidota bacterium]